MNRSILMVLALAGLLRVAVPVAHYALGLGSETLREPDSPSYENAAAWLRTAGSFGPPDAPEVERTPGYPLLLAAVAPLGDAGVVGMQILLSIATVVLVYCCGIVVGGRRAAMIAAAFYALDPLSIFYCSKVLSETAFTVAATAAVLLCLRGLSRGDWWQPAAAAASFAAAAYARPIAVPLLAIPPLVAVSRSSVAWPRRLAAIGIALLVSAATIAPWILRNRSVADYGGFSSISDEAIYFWQAAAVTARMNGRTLVEEQRRLGYADLGAYLGLHAEQRSWTRGDIYRYRRREGLAIIAAHSWLYGRIHVEGIAMSLLAPGVDSALVVLGSPTARVGVALWNGDWSAAVERMHDRPFVILFQALAVSHLIVVLLLAGIGAVRGQPRKATLLLAAVLGYLILASGGPHGTSRFRHPMMPILCVLAAIGAEGTRPPRREPA